MGAGASTGGKWGDREVTGVEWEAGWRLKLGPDGAKLGPYGVKLGPNGAKPGPAGAKLGSDGAKSGPYGMKLGPDGANLGPDGAKLGLVAVQERLASKSSHPRVWGEGKGWGHRPGSIPLTSVPLPAAFFSFFYLFYFIFRKSTSC